MKWRPAGLWRHRDFMKLWSGQAISKLGDHITGTALPLAAILALRASAFQVGALAALETAPILLVGLAAGAWVDRLRRRPILIATDLGRALALLAVPLAALLGLLRIELLYVVAAVVGAMSVFSTVAQQAFLPAMVSREQLVEGNSKLGASDSVAEIAGPPLGGVLVQWLTAPLAITFDAVSFLLSALLVGFIRAPEAAPSPVEQRQSLRREIGEGLRLVWAHPLLRALAGSQGTFNFFGSFIGALYALYLVQDLRLAPAVIGLLVGLGGVGALAGVLVVGPATRRFGLGATLIGALVGGVCLQLLIPLAGGPPTVVVTLLGAAQILGDVGIAVYLITEVSLRQAAIPARLLGRANASMHVLMQGVSPLGALLAGVVGMAIGVRRTLLLAVLGLFLAVLWLIFSPIRTLREPSAPPAEQDA
jgi:Na+/melibiose symporter-like transporter